MVDDVAVGVWPFECVVDGFAADSAGWVVGFDCCAVMISFGCVAVVFVHWGAPKK